MYIFDRKRDWIEVKMVVLCMFMSYQRIKAPVFVCGNIKWVVSTHLFSLGALPSGV